MSASNEIQINEAVMPYLDEIAERLWSGHAAVMVGAGFSKNKDRKGPSSPEFPNWHQLGDLFHEKIHGRKPENSKYLNVLRLADEVQAAFGRPALDQLIRSIIPDKDHEPSSLHVNLLKLPWTDVFTTNYDTLLERACTSVTSRKYDVVVNIEDLVYSAKPRIIKLHGSFPSERPFIVTEEDYRRYPKDFAPFVNTVQQALLENTLCLIGFSGDDPNFLQWIGWIRDNLGIQHSPKIFLVGIFQLSGAQIKLLEHRNIVLVDLASCTGIEGDHSKALDLFFTYLSSKKGEENRLGWPKDQEKRHPDTNNPDKVAQIKKLLSEWKKVRLSYPGWCILPEDRRNSLWLETQQWINFISSKDEFQAPYDLQFIFELNWRLGKCLCPILNNLVGLFEGTLQKYWPFAENTTKQIAVSIEKPEWQKLPWNEIRWMWVYLSLAMLRFYREEGLLEKWQATDKRLDGLYHYLSPDQKAFLHYERTLYALFALDLPEVENQIKAWPQNESIPFWEAKRAGLLAEIGEKEEAEKILEITLRNIRAKLNLKPVTTDYSFVSQEAYVMLLLRYVKGSFWLIKDTQSEDKELRQQFTERWNILKQYKCDPWNELKLFESCLEDEPVKNKEISEKQEFDIGRITRTHHFISWDQEAAWAYAFLRFCEDIGIPFRIPGATIGKKSAEGTLSRISENSPYWALATMIRIGDEKIVDYIFNRDSLHKMDVAFIDNLIYGYLNTIEKSQNYIKSGDGFHSSNFGILMAQVIPEILSRLSCKCSLQAKNKLFDFLFNIYNSELKNKYRGIRHLVNRLMEAYSNRQQFDMIPKLLEFNIASGIYPISRDEFPNPFMFLQVEREEAKKWKKSKLEKKHIVSLLTEASSADPDKRRWATFTLSKLYQLALLEKKDIDTFSKALWDQIDNFGLPANTVFYKFVFLDFPHPKNIDPVSLFKNYIKNTPFPIQQNQKGSGIAITGGRVPICNELLGASRSIQWTQEERTRLLQQLVEWWDTDKAFLEKEKKSYRDTTITDEFKARFSNLIDVLENVIAPYLSPETENNIKNDISRLFSEFTQFGLFALRAEAACSYIFLNNTKDLISRIEDALVSNNHELVVDGLKAVLVLIRKIKGSLYEVDVAQLLIALAHIIRSRKKIGLPSGLNAVTMLIKEQSSLFTNDMENLILKGLHFIITDTDLENLVADLNLNEKLEIRKSAAGLAHSLFTHYNKHDKPIPKVIDAWKEICHSENEFSEIRNQWLSTDD